jgi:HemY protein
LREALGEYFSARYSRAHKAALRALALRQDAPVLLADAEFGVLAQLLAAGSLHRLQDRPRRDTVMQALFQGMRRTGGHGVEDGARLLAAEWAIDDRDAARAVELLNQLPAGVARRTQALRLKLQASRLSRQPLEALHTARLLAKHQGFTPVAARGLLRSLVGEALDEAHDLQQLKRLWQQLDVADRRDAAVAARAASRAVALGSTADAREWLRPFWDRLGELERDDRDAVALALFDAAPGIEHEWLPRLEAAYDAYGHEPAVVVAVGMAFADRQLWGKARKLLDPSAAATSLPARVRRRIWRALALMAREGGDTARAQDCDRAAAALE